MTSRPDLSVLFLNGLDAAVPKKRLFGGDYLEFTTVAQVSGFLYQSGGILGVSKAAYANALASLVWNPALIDRYWELCRSQIQSRESVVGSLDALGLQMFFMRSEYPQLFGATALAAGLGNARAIEKIALQKIPFNSDMRLGWAGSLAEGIGFGILQPDRVRSMLDLDLRTVDPEEWKAWRDAGLAIPERQDVMTFDERASDIIEGFDEFIRMFYPELAPELGIAGG